MDGYLAKNIFLLLRVKNYFLSYFFLFKFVKRNKIFFRRTDIFSKLSTVLFLK